MRALTQVKVLMTVIYLCYLIITVKANPVPSESITSVREYHIKAYLRNTWNGFIQILLNLLVDV